jgi:hypothetical protein
LLPSGKAEQKYFERYAEPEAKLADRIGPVGHVLVVPAYGEGDLLVQMLESVPRGTRGEVLVVVVVNGKASAPSWVHEENRAVIGRMRRAFGERAEEIVSRDPPARLFAFARGRVLVIDRSDEKHWLPSDQGVGLARKIGVDLATRLHAMGRVASSFVHSTDADVVLPEDYFERSDEHEAEAALVYPFSHRPDDDPVRARAVLLYEISLRYYVLGLAFARSPHARHTIGSTIVTRAGAYVRVRGFPKRDAAEDFYILSKLAKVGPIASLGGKPIVISGRASSRVPFGTGAAVRRIASDDPRAFTMYDPRLFRYLGAWLEALDAIDLLGAPGDVDRAVREACARHDIAEGPLVATIDALGAGAAVASARKRSTSPDAFRRHLHTWFDAFRTLKLVHTLQRLGFTPRPWRDALREAPFARESLRGGERPSEDSGWLRALCESLAQMEPRLEPGGLPTSGAPE